MQLPEPRELLTRVYRAAVLAANPQQATRQAVKALEDLTPSVWVFAVGKGSHAMASGAVEALRARNIRVAGGLVVAHEADANATHGLDATEGDHPVPDARSFEASDRLARSLAQAGADTDAIVLASFGAELSYAHEPSLLLIDGIAPLDSGGRRGRASRAVTRRQ